MGLIDALFGGAAAKPSNAPSATMGWRYVAYENGGNCVHFIIEPMASGPDLVYIPSFVAWKQSAPSWARGHYYDTINFLKSVPWNRKLKWQASDDCSGVWSAPQVVPGSLESTKGGQWLESQRLFHAESKMSHEQAHELWHRLAEKFAMECTGKVTLHVSNVVENSVFQVVELPALKSNRNVQLEFK